MSRINDTSPAASGGTTAATMSELGRPAPIAGNFTGLASNRNTNQNAVAPRAALLPSARGPLRQHETQEAGYLLGRSVVGRPIDNPEQVQRLVLGNEKMNEVREALKHGTGNVKRDLEASGVDPTRVQAAYIIGRKYGGLAQAAAAVALGIGNCDHNGLLAAVKYAGAMAEGDNVHTISSSSWGHTWARAIKEGLPNNTLDPWAAGPAIESVDGQFQPDTVAVPPRFFWQKAEEKEVGRRNDLDAKEGRETAKTFSDVVTGMSPGGQFHGELQAALAEARDEGLKPRTYEEHSQIVSQPFAEEARAAVDKMNISTSKRLPGLGQGDAAYNLKQEIHAVAEARKAYSGLRIREAAKAAPGIIKEARSLDAQERPKPVPVPPATSAKSQGD